MNMEAILIRIESLEKQYEEVVKVANEVFVGPNAILPDFMKWGDSLTEGIKKLALAYKTLNQTASIMIDGLLDANNGLDEIGYIDIDSFLARKSNTISFKPTEQYQTPVYVLESTEKVLFSGVMFVSNYGMSGLKNNEPAQLFTKNRSDTDVQVHVIIREAKSWYQ